MQQIDRQAKDNAVYDAVYLVQPTDRLAHKCEGRHSEKHIAAV